MIILINLNWCYDKGIFLKVTEKLNVEMRSVYLIFFLTSVGILSIASLVSMTTTLCEKTDAVYLQKVAVMNLVIKGVLSTNNSLGLAICAIATGFYCLSYYCKNNRCWIFFFLAHIAIFTFSFFSLMDAMRMVVVEKDNLSEFKIRDKVVQTEHHLVLTVQKPGFYRRYVDAPECKNSYDLDLDQTNVTCKMVYVRPFVSTNCPTFHTVRLVYMILQFLANVLACVCFFVYDRNAHNDDAIENAPRLVQVVHSADDASSVQYTLEKIQIANSADVFPQEVVVTV